MRLIGQYLMFPRETGITPGNFNEVLRVAALNALQNIIAPESRQVAEDFVFGFPFLR